jgi:hypothetical protein
MTLKIASQTECKQSAFTFLPHFRRIAVRRSQPKFWILFLALLGMPAARAAAQPCPWLNAATAAGLLQGPVTVSVTYLDQENSDATCEFTHKADQTIRTLRIEVETMKNLSRDFPGYLAKCGRDAKSLRAIGNEAVVCSVPGRNKQITEQVVSRVRDRAFIVDVLSNGSDAERDAIRDKAQKIAEQVAGFLF